MQEDNKRIAKNTLIVYTRLVLTTIIGLVSSRYVLQLLGVSDYGLYNVVGAVIVMFSFLTSALYGTTTRFINYEQGKKDGDVNRVFNMSIMLHVSFSALTFLILETIGVIYIIYFLNVAAGKEQDAMFIFQLSTFVACIGLLAIPYQSLFVVHEKFTVIAIADLVFSLLRFLSIILLLFCEGNALRLYAICNALFTLLSSLLFVFLSIKKWPEVVKWKLVKQKKLYKEMFVFNNYNLLGTVSLILRNQGSNVLINFFFGTIVNAAYAVSFSIQSYITTFVGNFDTASGPQITQNIGRGNMERSFYLTTNTCRICILLTLLLLFPIACEMEFLLHLWLGANVPDGTASFCKCTLLVALVSATSGGLTQLINGTGQLKWFVLQYTILYVITLFVGTVFFVYDFPPYSIILLFFAVDIISRINQLYILKRLILFDVGSFIKQAYIKPLFVFACGFVYFSLSQFVEFNAFYSHFLNFIVSIIFMMLSIYCLGLYRNERSLAKSLFLKKYSQLKN